MTEGARNAPARNGELLLQCSCWYLQAPQLEGGRVPGRSEAPPRLDKTLGEVSLGWQDGVVLGEGLLNLYFLLSAA